MVSSMRGEWFCTALAVCRVSPTNVTVCSSILAADDVAAQPIHTVDGDVPGQPGLYPIFVDS